MERVSQQGIIDVGLSDHQPIYCTTKFSCTKLGTDKQITFRSLKDILLRPIKRLWVKYACQIMKTLLIGIKLMKTSFKN